MKKLVYKPKEDDFEGSIEIVVPSMRQRMKIFRECRFKQNAEGEISGMDNLEAMEKMYEIAEDFVKKVNIKHKSGSSFKSFKAMSEDSDCDDICQNIIKFVLEGSLGEE